MPADTTPPARARARGLRTIVNRGAVPMVVHAESGFEPTSTTLERAELRVELTALERAELEARELAAADLADRTRAESPPTARHRVIRPGSRPTNTTGRTMAFPQAVDETHQVMSSRRRLASISELYERQWTEGTLDKARWWSMFSALATGAETEAQVVQAASLADHAYMELLRREQSQ